MKTTIMITLSFLLMLASCTSNKDEETGDATENVTTVETGVVQMTAAQIKNAGIIAGRPVTREMSGSLMVNGMLESPPENIYAISIPLGGYIKSTRLIPGMMVRKGSVLATVEDQAYVLLQQEYLVAKNKLRFAEADYNRQKGLNSTKATSDKLFQQTENDYNHQKIMLSSLAQQLRLIGLNPGELNDQNISRTIQVHSPVDGYVTKVNVNSGKYVNATDVLFELINPGKLHLSLTVLENDASALKTGQKIVCTTNNTSGETYTAVIKLITPNINDDRSVSVHCDLLNGNKTLMPGTYMNATIKTNPASVNSLPGEAIVKWENKLYVFSDEGNLSYKMIPVETGVENDGFTEIRSTLPDNNIVTRNAYALLMKLKNTADEGG